MSTLQERLRALADPQYGLARGFDDAQATINEAADALDAAEDRIDELSEQLAAIDARHFRHEPFPAINYSDGKPAVACCDACIHPWPCPDHLTLHPTCGPAGCLGHKGEHE